jgi:AmmeMemoRadiSam system protein B/AmmeMemoRadiSam system protein A
MKTVMGARSSGRAGAAALAVLAAAVSCPRAASPQAGEARPPALAGSWYPAGRASLLVAADFLLRLADAAPSPPRRPVALVVPHAGWNYSGLAAAAGWRLLRHGDFDRVVVMAPSHRGGFAGYALADVSAYDTPLGRVPVCAGTTEQLRGEEARVVPGVAGPEHSIEVELPFLQVVLPGACIVPVLVGDTGPDMERAFADRLARLDDGRTLFVISSDFLHYGPRYDYAPYGALSAATLGWIRDQDRRAIELIGHLDAPSFRAFLERTRATICGRHGLLTLLHLLPRIAPDARATLLAHYLSADLPSANEDASVSYVALAFSRPASAPSAPTRPAPPIAPPLTTLPFLDAATAETPPLHPEDGARLLRLARAALLTELRETDDLPAALRSWSAGREHMTRQGVFVSLYEKGGPGAAHGALRGCIGQADPRLPLYYGTVQVALDAALHDPRFPPVTGLELDRLEVEVSVLWPRRPVASWRDIRLGPDGIVLEKDDRSALFLPQATATFDSLEDALSALARKAGLPADGWREGARFSVFHAQVFAEGR